MKTKLLIAAFFGSALIAQNAPLANGIYAVEKADAKGGTLPVRQYKGKDLVLNTANFAPLAVEGQPEVRRDERSSSLMMQLGPEAAKRLEALSRAHIDEPIAIVVGDKIVSAPTLRSVIKDGKAQVGPCDDPSCESLIRQLGK
jgi:preprotein translocase subunit SecD